MPGYLRIKQILDEAVNGEDFAAHGPFWRSLTRDQFVNKSIFGRKVIVQRPDGTFDPDESNLVKALEGRAPFGKNLMPPPPGAIWPRMPDGYDPVPSERIQEIRDWIVAGCPDVDPMRQPWIAENAGGPLADPAPHNDYFRDFDNWAMFNATPQTQDDINTYFSAADAYFAYALDAAQEPGWVAALLDPNVMSAVMRLEQQQRDTVVAHYGRPVALRTLLDGFVRFGDDSLPDDPQRPLDVRHNMNGESMWFFWSAFADACLRLSKSTPIPADFWYGFTRAILIGLLNDGLFRGRFSVAGITADPAGREVAMTHVLNLVASDLPAELMKRLRESGVFG